VRHSQEIKASSRSAGCPAAAGSRAGEAVPDGAVRSAPKQSVNRLLGFKFDFLAEPARYGRGKGRAYCI